MQDTDTMTRKVNWTMTMMIESHTMKVRLHMLAQDQEDQLNVLGNHVSADGRGVVPMV